MLPFSRPPSAPGPPLRSQACISAHIWSVTTQHGAQTLHAHTKPTRKRRAYRHSSGSSFYVCVLEEACTFAGYLLVCLSAGIRLFYPICTGTLRAHVCVKKRGRSARPYLGRVKQLAASPNRLVAAAQTDLLPFAQ